ncbi:uncharacterized protein [Aristolochia californica]|uniref:uncharacterized protein n=1 Tax=Aristolochia californica TaxID=171875 RepID=UPI0035DAE85A
MDRRAKQDQLQVFAQNELTQWKQLACFWWLSEGDANTKFFHVVASARCRTNRITLLCAKFFHIVASARYQTNRITLLCINGEVTFGWSSITNSLVSFFASLYTDTCHSRSLVQNVHSKRIPGVVANLIEFPFSVRELEKATLGLPCDRTPSTYGYNGEFYCHAFIKCRNILDPAMLSHELLHHFKMMKLPQFILELDFEKAYDRVNCQLLDHLLTKKGFGQRWRFWIHNCITSATYSLLINGTICGLFKGTRSVQ